MEKHIKDGSLLTAEKFCNEYLGFEQYGTDVPYFMIEFAKIHVEAALKEANKKGKCSNGTSVILKDSILNSYPLENIK